jgi:hypothetical protein
LFSFCHWQIYRFLTGYFRNPHVWFVLFSFQRSLSHQRQLLYSIKSETRCQHLFSRNFQVCFKLVTVALSNNSYISLALQSLFVNTFFKTFFHQLQGVPVRFLQLY